MKEELENKVLQNVNKPNKDENIELSDSVLSKNTTTWTVNMLTACFSVELLLSVGYWNYKKFK